MASADGTRETSLLDTAAAGYAALVVLIALAVLIAPGSGPLHAVAAVGLLPLFVYYLCAALFRGARAFRSRRARALGDGVRHALAALGDAYRVASCTPDGSDREHHVAVGPNGVFVIVAADDRARLAAARKRLLPDARPRWRDLIEDCHIESLRASERLRRDLGVVPPLHAILCLRHALVPVGREVRGVRVVQLRDLARVVGETHAPAALDARAIGAAAAALTAVAPVIALRARPATARVIPLDRRQAARRPTLV